MSLLQNSGTAARHYADWTVGDVRELSGYVSSSVRFKDAKGFYDRELGSEGGPLMLQINVPRGTSCLFIGDNTAFPRYQGEMLLAHGLKYKVVSKTLYKLILEVV